MRLSRQFQDCLLLFFYQKVLEKHQKAPKRKTNNFQFFVRIKNVAFVV